MKVTVESAHLRDITELMRVERECFTGEAFTKKQILFLLTNSSSVSLVAKVNDEVAGFMIGVVENHSAIKSGHILTVDVALKHRRQGLGMKLLEDMETALIKRGVENIYLEVRKDNKAAMGLYRKQGYKKIGFLDQDYSKRVHGFRLIKQIKA